MLRSLRNRLILSHALPLLIIVPLMGIVLVYVMETQYVVPSLSSNLEEDARLIADIARDYPEIWSDSRLAGDLLNRLSPGRIERIMLVTTDGVLLGSTDPNDLARLNLLIDIPGLAQVLRGEPYSSTRYSPSLRGEVIDVVVPVVVANGAVIGLVRMTYHYSNFYEELIRLRYLIATILLASLLVGIALGSLLAVNIGRPIQQVTQAVFDLASGRRTDLLPEKGPEEVRQLRRAANYLVARLHNLEGSRRKLLANLVHELGRPLGALSAAIQALRRGAKEDQKLLEEFLEGMEHETNMLKRVTEDLSHLHDQVVGPLELEYQTIALGDWLALNLRPWQAAAQEQRLRWETDIQSNLPALKADPDRLAQALGNLVSNAIKFTPMGGLISVSAGLRKGEVWVIVHDTGPGLTKEEQEKAFLPFFKGGQGKRFSQGMGLGLSIAHDLITAHGGRIEVESTPGLGSNFTIWLPVIP